MLKLIIFFAVVSSIFCGKLSEEFDEERAGMCGKALTPEKPSKNPADDKAPWTVGVNFGDYFSSGILVSPRHVLAPGLYAVNQPSPKIWKWIDDVKVDMSECNDNQMKIPKKTLKSFSVILSLCRDPEQCGTRIKRSVVEGYYLGNCVNSEVPFGMILLEISSNVPQDEPFFTPVCIPAEEKSVFIGDTVHFDSFKVGESGEIHITSDSANIEKCGASIGRFVQSVCGKRSVCNKEARRGALVKKIENRDTVIAIMWEEDDKCKTEHYVSVGFFKDKLCNLAGICKATYTAEESSASSIQFFFFGFFIILGSFAIL
ncbi:hypothetical protein GCK72_002684 [Caenorhabditis remanei]|uniref:Peptidase S1 domain-containing protein n=1 Tax=Caenorhabditis remanei TaxID=31234 RepID=A0A6A5HRN1_CAERE|nr:hypothetical protein GCK72_002684 [Caenorhabditis remanei]KAF1770860.1 hypothetical protein GCK72_002684 [Caenorhabditis remanei]